MTTPQQEWEPTEKQKQYWKSMKNKTGNKAVAWKGDKASVSAFHTWLTKHHGRPDVCENRLCMGGSNIFEWCLKKGRKYSHNIEDYLRMCRSCHRKYDLTQEKRLKAIKNLSLYNPYAKRDSYKRFMD